jgi:hypothetical protein
LLKEDQLYLLDGYAIHKGGLRMDDVLWLAVSAEPYATRTELYRAWKRLGRGGAMPKANRRSRTVWKESLGRAFEEGRYFGRLRTGGWEGHFFRCAKFPCPWSAASRLEVSEEDWAEAFPLLLEQLEGDQFEILKRTESGDVLGGGVVLGGRPVGVVVKRPRRKYWYRYISEIGRGSRVRRAWRRAWQLVARSIPTAWPLLMMERRLWGYVVEALAVFERIPGRTLAQIHPREDEPARYRGVLVGCGRLLRKIEQSGLYMYDAKAENWMIREDEKAGPTPMLIDVESVRRLNQGGGLKRLLRSLRDAHGGAFGAGDALALARGYAPFAGERELERLAGIAANETEGGG